MTGQPPKPTLADYFGKYGVERGTIESLFYRVCLPLPKKGQYFITSDAGVIVFLERFGALLRISQPERERSEAQQRFRPEPVDHPAVVQPLVTFNHGSLCAEILPAHGLGWNMKDVTFLKEKLEADGLEFFDRGVENIGYLHLGTSRHPSGLPVVIDRNSVRRVKDIPPAADPDYDYARRFMKEMLEHELRPLFEKAWGDGTGPVDRKAMVGFWKEVMLKVSSGITRSDWTKPEFKDIIYYHMHGQTSDAQKISKRYDMQIDSHIRSLGLTPPALSAADLGLDY